MAPTIYTVSQITAYMKSLFSEDLLLGDLWLSGEVSNFKQASSGHCYFTLKDPGSCIRAVVWRTQAVGMALPREGEAVTAHGYVSVYEPRGDYQFYVDHLEPGGVGWLWQEYQRLKSRLEAAGLFDAMRKRPIPALPTRLGVATSPTGAALRDILRTIEKRFPLVEIILAPTPVQGAQAPAGIVAALEALNTWAQSCAPLDAIILARGGGSIEELWAFNDEQVAYAIARSAVPVITGVGHETDFTIADFVADLRAPTPTGAAMAAVPDARELAADVAELVSSAEMEMANRLASQREKLAALSNQLALLSPGPRLARDRQRMDDLLRRAEFAMQHHLDGMRERLNGQRLYLAGMHPTNVLSRGYALVTKADGSIVNSVAQVASGEVLRVRVADGSFAAVVVREQ